MMSFNKELLITVALTLISAGIFHAPTNPGLHTSTYTYLKLICCQIFLFQERFLCFVQLKKNTFQFIVDNHAFM